MKSNTFNGSKRFANRIKSGEVWVQVVNLLWVHSALIPQGIDA
jgi:hypothetical protein